MARDIFEKNLDRKGNRLYEVTPGHYEGCLVAHQYIVPARIPVLNIK